MIFGWWTNYLNRRIDVKISSINRHTDTGDSIFKANRSIRRMEYWFKPIGLCPYCYGTWIGIVWYLILIPHNLLILKPYTIILFISFMGINIVFIMILMRLYTKLFN